MRVYIHSEAWKIRKEIKDESQQHSCQICGLETINPKFCSNKCVGIYNKQNPNHGTWNNGHPSSKRGQEIAPREIRICKICNTEMRVYLISTKQYCSKKCQAMGSRGRNLVEKVLVECNFVDCHNQIKMSSNAAKKLIEAERNHFCSKECEHKWRLWRFSGERNPMFGLRNKNGGFWKKGNIPWNAGKKEAKRHSCQICGIGTLNLKFCSNQCTAEYNRIRLTGMVSKVKGVERLSREIRLCKICNKEMRVKLKATKKYCSNSCRYKGVGEDSKGRPAWNRGRPNLNNKTYYPFKAGYREDLGHFVRSSWEADFARLWKYLGATYEYEKHRFDLDELGTYCPDFYLPNTNRYYEVKGRMDMIFLEKRLKRLYEKYHIQINMLTYANFLWMLVWIRENLPDLFETLENKHLVKRYNWAHVHALQDKEYNKIMDELASKGMPFILPHILKQLQLEEPETSLATYENTIVD